MLLMVAALLGSLSVAMENGSSSSPPGPKYELIMSDVIHVDGHTLHRIKRLQDGVLGGYIESEGNLSQTGTCFLDKKSRAYGQAVITQDAQLHGSARDSASISGQAEVYGEAFGTSRVSGNAKIYGRVYDAAQVDGWAVVHGDVYENGHVTDHAQVFGNVYGHATVGDHEVVFGDRH
jgi:hypothetical protein